MIESLCSAPIQNTALLKSFSTKFVQKSYFGQLPQALFLTYVQGQKRTIYPYPPERIQGCFEHRRQGRQAIKILPVP